jgi:hypothetical protein
MPDIDIKSLALVGKAIVDYLYKNGAEAAERVVHPDIVVVMVGKKISNAAKKWDPPIVDTEQPFSQIVIHPHGKIVVSSCGISQSRVVNVHNPESFPLILKWVRHDTC